MNSIYSCLGNNKVLVTNENGKQRIVENYDNINEILIEENVIESIQNKVNELEEKNKKYEKINKKRYIPIMVIISIFVTKVIFPMFFGAIDLNNFTFYNDVIQFDEMCLLLNFSTISLATGLDIGTFIQHKKNQKKEKGIKSELEYLNKCLKKEQKKMQKMFDKGKRLENSKRFCNFTVRSSDKIDDINRYLEFYYNIGYNSDKYYNYYLNGNMEEILQKKYTDEDSILVNEYFKNQSNSHVKKKVKKL